MERRDPSIEGEKRGQKEKIVYLVLTFSSGYIIMLYIMKPIIYTSLLIILVLVILVPTVLTAGKVLKGIEKAAEINEKRVEQLEDVLKQIREHK